MLKGVFLLFLLLYGREQCEISIDFLILSFRSWNDKLQKLMLSEYPIFEDLVTGRHRFVPFAAGRRCNMK